MNFSNPDPDVSEATRAARALRAINSPKQQETSRANGKLGGRPLKSIEKLDCTCGQCPDSPRTYCPRGRAILKRLAKGQPLEGNPGEPPMTENQRREAVKKIAAAFGADAAKKDFWHYSLDPTQSPFNQVDEFFNF